MLKDYLLSLGCFIDNKYLDEYLSLIERPFTLSDYSEKHHIIPVSFYATDYSVDRHLIDLIALKDPNNKLVRLSYSDHFYAHWLLYNCTTGKIKSASAKTLLIMSGHKNILKLPKLKIAEIKQQIKKDSDYYWSADEDLQLAELYANNTAVDDIAKKLNKTASATKTRITRLHLSNRSWTDQEVEWLKQNYKQGNKFCAKYLNRSESSIEHKITRLRISSRQWTMQEVNWLKANYKKYTKEELAAHLKRSSDSIYSKMSRLGL